MCIDDGVPSRGHRNNLFGKFLKVGVSSGAHKTYSHFSVINFFGAPQTSDLSFDKYQIEKDDWPENAISLSKHMESKVSNNKKTIILKYTFTMSDGEKVIKTKEFVEDV